jgi:membrane protein DedA with SNARE-associated domain
MQLIDTATEYLLSFSELVPVEIFTFTGALVEEIIAPIPSPIVMTLSGSLASAQEKALIYVLWLALVGAIGKIIGSYVLYVISDKFEDVFLAKFGKFLGISHKEVESIGQHFTEGGKDFWIVFFSRVVPIMPTAPVSVVAGLVKLNLRTYLLSSFLGYIGRNLIYLYIGYVGVESYEGLMSGVDSVESVVQLIIGAGLVIGVGYMYTKRGKVDVLEWFKTKFRS